MTRRTVPAYLTTGLSSLVELVAITDELKQQLCVWICDCVFVSMYVWVHSLLISHTDKY